MKQGNKKKNYKNNLSAKCRLCIMNFDPEDMLDIFDETAESIATRITRMLRIELCYGDGLPSTVCIPCAENLSCSSQFIADSLETEDSLRKVVTFISEVSGPGLEVQSITEETLELFEIINGNKEHISSVCRLCMTQHKSSEMSKIFADAENSLEKKIRKLVCLEPTEGDGLPEFICDPCVSKLNAIENLVTTTFSNDYLLKNEIYQTIKIETNIKEEPKLELEDIEQVLTLGLDDTNEMDISATSTDSLDLLATSLKEEPMLMTWSPPDEKVEDMGPTGTGDGQDQVFKMCILQNKMISKQQPDCSISPSIDKLFTCALYATEFHYKKNLRPHFIVADNQSSCQKISPGSQQKITSSATNARHTKAKPTHFCDVCKRNFCRKSALEKHVALFHSKELLLPSTVSPEPITPQRTRTFQAGESRRKSWICDVCKKLLSRKHTLVEHMRVHTGERPYACTVCSRTFTTKGQLNCHAEIHGNQACICVVCKKLLSSKRRLVQHMGIHTGDRPYACTVCSKAYTTQSQLTRHAQIHSGKQACICNVCKKLLSSKHTLLNHMRLHTGERPYACTVCSKAYTTQGQLTIHLEKHTGDGPHSCTVCSPHTCHICPSLDGRS